ncbi:MAG: C40 family peptidase [Halofilum sp. (in: g-proteobacteria)]|nr:C40 family peptidase [Halofilum sp. (in: g-proteobacteria)]
MRRGSPRDPRVRLAALGLVALLLAGCAGTRVARPPADPVAERVAEIAIGLRGTPYRFGGDGPGGFDCSGLVHYAYEQAGARVPRTARGQYEAVRRLYVEQLVPGDVVFFRTGGALVSHVGIYVGRERFVHALNAGEPVRVSRLDSSYWQSRLIRAGSLAR